MEEKIFIQVNASDANFDTLKFIGPGPKDVKFLNEVSKSDYDRKVLEDYTEWLDEKTYWKEDNDITNGQVITEYLTTKEK